MESALILLSFIQSSHRASSASSSETAFSSSTSDSDSMLFLFSASLRILMNFSSYRIWCRFPVLSCRETTMYRVFWSSCLKHNLPKSTSALKGNESIILVNQWIADDCCTYKFLMLGLLKKYPWVAKLPNML